MDTEIITFLIITAVLQGDAVSLRRQLDHIAKTKAESQGILNDSVLSRRTFYKFDPRELSPILGAPSRPSHLPEAEPLLPGHTLLKPALGMLKSAVKFPHKDFEDGSGVYGNPDNIGIRYDSKNERVLYTGFRRMPSIAVAPPRPGNSATGGETNLRSSIFKNDLGPGPVVQSNKMSLHQNDNKEPLSEQKNNGQIYLKRVYLSKMPLIYRVVTGKKKILDPFYNLKILRKDDDNNMANDVEDTISQEAATKDFEINRADDANNQSVNQRSKPWSYKNAFDRVVLDQNAPEFSDVFPPVLDNHRQWSFYNEG